jgi:hypothetical protein
MAELRLQSTGTVKLFESDDTSSITIASPASLGADRTITLPDGDVTLVAGTMSTGFVATDITGQTALGETPTTTDEFVLSDAGTLKKMDAKWIMGRPMFRAYMGADQTVADGTVATIAYNTESFDQDSTFDTTAYKFTPGVAGVYAIGAYIRSTATSAFNSFYIYLKVNGSTFAGFNSVDNVYKQSNQVHELVYLDADDYIQGLVYHNLGSDVTFEGGAISSVFYGSRVVGYE